MRSRVIVVTTGDGEFRLITEFGFPIGSRLLSVAAEKGRDLPELTDRFVSKIAAQRAALRWNQYLLHAHAKKSKQKGRISE